MAGLNFLKIKLVLKKEIKKLFNLSNLKNNLDYRRKLKICALIFLLIPIFSPKQLISDINNRSQIEKNKIIWKKTNLEKKTNVNDIIWEKTNLEKKTNENDIFWKNIDNNKDNFLPSKEFKNYQDLSKNNNEFISSFNRSIVFNDSIVGPDISWLVPPGFKWNNKYKFDSTVSGYSESLSKEFHRERKGFLGWNSGDAVGNLYYQFINKEKTSFGLNLGIRSVYSGSAAGGSTAIGESKSLGFRMDRKLSPTSGFAFGAEQLLHFDAFTDTGRNIYLTLSKAIWSNNNNGQFPLDIYTFGVATGRMAEGNIKFLCSDLLGGSGTEYLHQRSLCWAPVFSISRVYNKKISTIFEYNSKWFVLGTSIIPFNEIPLRGTFAVQLSDHIDNYKLNKFDELKWVFRLSLGF